MNDIAPRITIDTPVEFADVLPDKVDVAVIGGGVIGVFTALYLARMGQKVLVCEKGRIAGEQSSRNWGWIRQHGRDRGELPIMIEAIGLWQEVDRETNGQCGVVTTGTTYLADTEAALAQYEKFIPLAKSHGVGTRVMTQHEVGEMFGGVSTEQWVGGVTTPNDCKGEPFTAVPAVARLARQAGALVREECAVRALDIASGRIAGVVTENGRVACDQVVLAGGAWSSLLARRHGIILPQLSVRSTAARTVAMPEFTTGNSVDSELAVRRRSDGGYTLALNDTHDFFIGPDAFRHFFKYLKILRHNLGDLRLTLSAPPGFPDSWGTRRTWSADEVSPFEQTRVLEPEPNRKYVQRMVERFEKRFPSIGRPQIAEAWAGMIDAMPDEVPVLDRVPTLNGLIIATGMSGHGFGIGPGFGRVLAHMATGQDHGHDLSRFRIGRFSDGSALELGPTL